MTQSDNVVFLQIQNSKKPEQIISLVLDEATGHFETQGLRANFGVEEVWVERDEFLQGMDEYAQVLSFLLETMSAAQDLNLPYGYLDRFEYKGQGYSLFRENRHRVLKKLE
ncbi:MAG: hypothetical protein WAW37_18250 [Syntrophobacteraceae bacterium]